MAICSACFAQRLLGIISVKVRIKNVIIPVEIPIARASSIPDVRAISIAILVAKEAVKVLRRLLPIRIVIRSRSVFCLSFWSVRAPNVFFFTKESIRWAGRDIIAISAPEKKAEKKSKIPNKSIVIKSIIISQIKCSIMKYLKNTVVANFL